MDTGEEAARDRVDAAFRAVDGLGREMLWAPLPRRDLEDRAVRLNDLERAIEAAGRSALLAEARSSLGDALAQRLVARGRQPEVGIFGISEMGRPEEIAAVRLALDDLLAVAVGLDLVDPDEAAALAGPAGDLLGFLPFDVPPS